MKVVIDLPDTIAEFLISETRRTGASASELVCDYVVEKLERDKEVLRTLNLFRYPDGLAWSEDGRAHTWDEVEQVYRRWAAEGVMTQPQAQSSIEQVRDLRDQRFAEAGLRPSIRDRKQPIEGHDASPSGDAPRSASARVRRSPEDRQRPVEHGAGPDGKGLSAQRLDCTSDRPKKLYTKNADAGEKTEQGSLDVEVSNNRKHDS